jgi:hypothetical protein
MVDLDKLDCKAVNQCLFQSRRQDAEALWLLFVDLGLRKKIFQYRQSDRVSRTGLVVQWRASGLRWKTERSLAGDKRC